MRAADLARRASFEVATLGWGSRALTLSTSRALHHGVVVDDTTDVVVEGFPRSGNTLAVELLSRANPGLRIGHHLHAPAHVLEAVRRRTPTLVVVREPAAAAAALLESKPFLTLADAVRAWRRFHVPLERVRPRVVFATWDDVHQRFADVVERLNARFGTAFEAPAPDAEIPEVEHRGHLPVLGGIDAAPPRTIGTADTREADGLYRRLLQRG